MKMELTQHVYEDRANRIEIILSSIGIGDIANIFPSRNQYGPTELCVTTTGMLLVRVPNQNRLITAYALRKCDVEHLYKSNGYVRVPTRIMNVVCNNERKRKFLYQF